MSKVLPFLEWSRMDSLAGKVGLWCRPQMLEGLGPSRTNYFVHRLNAN